MTDPILAHGRGKIKYQIDPQTKKLAYMFRRHGDLDNMIIGEVLAGSNSEAANVLKSLGCDILIPTLEYAPISKICEFFNVDGSYLYSQLHSEGITNCIAPKDIVSTGVSLFLHYQKLLDFGNLVREESAESRTLNYTYLANGCEPYKFTTSISSHTRFYSARMILVFAMIFHKSRRGRRVCTTSDIYSGIAKTPYGQRAMRRIKERLPYDEELEIEEPREEEVTGGATLRIDDLKALIKSAVAEAISDAGSGGRMQTITITA